MDYQTPQLGDLNIRVYQCPTSREWNVDVKVFKKNTLRGDSYWVTKAFKSYKKEKDALAFAARFS